MTSNRLEQLLKLYTPDQADPFIIFAIAKEYEKMQDDKQALDHYLLLLKDHPEYIGTYYHLGKLYERLESPLSAWNTYKKGMGIAQKAGDQHAYSELAGAKLMLGDEEDFEE